MRWRHALSFVGLALTAVSPSFALDIHGRAEIQDIFASEDSQSLSAALGERTRNDVLGDLRLIWEPRAGPWSFAVHYELSADAGGTPELTMRRAALALFPETPPPTWWDLSDTFVNRAHFTATQRIDRLWVAYTGTHLVVRAGRQALTWGSGLVFRPMDLFDPFAPDATDTEYKPGTDMFYGQWLFDDGSDLQLVVVPRPPRAGAAPTSNASSYALRYHAAFGMFQTTWLVARDHRDWVAAFGLNGPLGGATWNLELVPTFVHAGPVETSLVANISDATTLFDRDATLFLEYYRNGFGLGGTYSLSDLPAPLTDRLIRGQLFDTGRDYLAAGGQLQWSPLLEITPTLIANLNDASFYGFIQATYSLRENLNLVAGVEIPVGPSGTEFGGIPLTSGIPPFFETPARAYLQLRQYF